MTQYVQCRVCDAGCGLQVSKSDEGFSLNPDPSDPISAGFICDTAVQSVSALSHSSRYLQPHRRTNGVLTAESWDTALGEISAALKTFRAESPNSIGLLSGSALKRNSEDWLRTMAFATAMGTSSVFSDLCAQEGPRLLVTEWMMGHAAHLLSDLARAHHVILLGSDPDSGHWGQPGMSHKMNLQHSRKTKATKVICASSRKSSFAENFDQHISIRPGTEAFFMLGMLQIIIKSGWIDRQYIRDYTVNIEKLSPLLEEWSVARCAEICGIKTAVLSGIALKFSRSAMGVVHPGNGVFCSPNATFGAWAWLATHMATANALRPGGIYENRGAFDLYPLLMALREKNAPVPPSTDRPLFLMQAPMTAIGRSPLRALIVLGDVSGLSRKKLRHKLKDVDLVGACSSHPSWITEEADWILPTPSSWELPNRDVVRNASLPCYALPYSPPLTPPRGDSRSISDILKGLYQATGPGWKKSSWGIHLQVFGRVLSKADIPSWSERLLRLAVDENLKEEPGPWFRGESDRSLWRPASQRLDFAPEVLPELFASLRPPTVSSEFPLLLRSSALVDRASGDSLLGGGAQSEISVHPSLGFQDGDGVRLRTAHGIIEVPVRVDPGLREDAVDAPFIRVPEILDILPEESDKWSGTPVFDGVPCHVEKA